MKKLLLSASFWLRRQEFSGYNATFIWMKVKDYSDMTDSTTKGDGSNEALLIIDMQIGCFHTPRHDREGVISRINKLSHAFRAKNLPVIFIQHNGIKENYLLPGTEDFEIVRELVISDADYTVEKTVNGAFYKTNLKELLDSLNVGTLYITGLATDFCVNATIHAALVEDFNIVVVSDCHTTADKLEMSASEIIKFHNFIWSNLTPTEGIISLQTHEEVLS